MPRNNSIFQSSLQPLFNKKNELKASLKKLHEELTDLAQDVNLAPIGFHDRVTELIEPAIIENPDKEVRVLAGCCFTEILRIYAPEAPYSDADMLRVFHVLITSIRGLETQSPTSPLGEKMVTILNSIAVIKSCAVPVFMSQAGVPGAMETLHDLFDAAVTLIRPDHAPQLFDRSLEILHSCITENDGLTEDLLEILLKPLLPSARMENPSAFRVVGTVLRSCAALIKDTVSKVINNMLVSGGDHGLSQELSDDLYLLIFELHSISPEFLREIIPTLTMQLKLEEDDIRSKATRLLASLYASKAFDYASEFTKEFEEFVGRMNDHSAIIRGEVIDLCSNLLKDKPALFSVIEDSLVKRLRDSEEDVRMKALSALLAFASENLTVMRLETVKAMTERAVDKKFEIRKTVLTGLSKLYGRYVTSYITPLNQARLTDVNSLVLQVDREVLDRLHNVPETVIKSWGYPDLITRHLVVQLLQENILFYVKGKQTSTTNASQTDNELSSEDENKQNDSCAKRASALLYLLANLEEADRTGVIAILTFKKRIQETLNEFLKARAAEGGRRKSSSSDDQGEQFSSAKAHLSKLTQLVPPADSRKSLPFEKLLLNKDKFVYRCLDACVGVTDTIEESVAHREDLLRRLDSKSLLAEYFHIVFDFAGPLFCNQKMAELLLTSMLSVGLHPYQELFCDLITILTSAQPKLFGNSADHLIEWMEMAIPSSENERGKALQYRTTCMDSFIRTTNNVAQYVEEEKLVPLVKKLLSYLHDCSNLALGAKLAELIVHIVVVMPEGSSRKTIEDNWIKYLKELCKRNALQVDSSSLPLAMALLSAFYAIPTSAYHSLEFGIKAAQSMTKALSPLRNNIIQFVLHDLIAKESVSVELKLGAIGLFTAILCTEEECKQLLEIRDQQTRFSNDAPVQPRLSLNPDLGSAEFVNLLNLLFECLESGGSILNGMKLVDISKNEKIELYEKVGVCIISLMKTKRFGDHVEVGQWQELAWAFLVNNQETRRTLLEALTTVMQIHQVHPRFLCYPCLFANDEDNDLVELSQSSLLSAIRRLRVTHENIEAKLVSTQNVDLHKRLEAMAAFTMPEKVLPYLLYLLSYHPNCPANTKLDKEEDRKGMKALVRCIQSLIQALQATLRKESNHLPFLFKLLNQIVQYHADRHDRSNNRLYFVTRLAIKLLQDQIKTSDNVQTYPGTVHLPGELFEKKKDKKDGQRQNKAADGEMESTEMPDDIEQAIKQAVQLGKSKGRAFANAGVSSSAAGENVGHASPNSSGKKRAKKSLSPLMEGGESDQDSEDEDYGLEKKRRRVSAKSGRAAKVEKGKPGNRNSIEKYLLVQSEAPTRMLPRRIAKAVVNSYQEPDESDREVEQWNEEAGKQQRKSISGTTRRRSSSPMMVSPIPAEKEDQQEKEEMLDLFEPIEDNLLLDDSNIFSTSKRRKSSANKPDDFDAEARAAFESIIEGSEEDKRKSSSAGKASNKGGQSSATKTQKKSEEDHARKRKSSLGTSSTDLAVEDQQSEEDLPERENGKKGGRGKPSVEDGDLRGKATKGKGNVKQTTKAKVTSEPEETGRVTRNRQAKR